MDWRPRCQAPREPFAVHLRVPWQGARSRPFSCCPGAVATSSLCSETWRSAGTSPAPMARPGHDCNPQRGDSGGAGIGFSRCCQRPAHFAAGGRELRRAQPHVLVLGPSQFVLSASNLLKINSLLVASTGAYLCTVCFPRGCCQSQEPGTPWLASGARTRCAGDLQLYLDCRGQGRGNLWR